MRRTCWNRLGSASVSTMITRPSAPLAVDAAARARRSSSQWTTWRTLTTSNASAGAQSHCRLPNVHLVRRQSIARTRPPLLRVQLQIEGLLLVDGVRRHRAADHVVVAARPPSTRLCRERDVTQLGRGSEQGATIAFVHVEGERGRQVMITLNQAEGMAVLHTPMPLVPSGELHVTSAASARRAPRSAERAARRRACCCWRRTPGRRRAAADHSRVHRQRPR